MLFRSNFATLKMRKVAVSGWLAVAALAFGLPGPAVAQTADLPPSLARSDVSGPVTYRLLGIPIYEAKLFKPRGEGFDWNRPFALQLQYAKTISGDRLLSATMSELRRMEGQKDDHAEIELALATCFRDVSSGDRYLAYAVGPDRVDFWLNGSKTCEAQHPGLRNRFLGIWLSDESRAQNLTRRLRGQG